MLNYSMAWVTIAAQNFEKTQDFYCKFLDKSPEKTLGPENALIYAEFQLKGLTIGIYRPKTSNSVLESSPISICFQVENLETAIAHLSSIGYPAPGEILTPHHGREIYAFDPDGNRLILYEPHGLN
jgi:predicted enzyme related to lactoylglutathione lyase